MAEMTNKEMVAEAKKISDKVMKLRKKRLKAEKEIRRLNEKWWQIRIFEEMKRLISALDLPDNLSDALRRGAIEIYVTANANIDNLRKRNIESIAAACLILACEKTDANISFSTINKNSPERGCIIGGVYDIIKYNS